MSAKPTKPTMILFLELSLNTIQKLVHWNNTQEVI